MIRRKFYSQSRFSCSSYFQQRNVAMRRTLASSCNARLSTYNIHPSLSIQLAHSSSIATRSLGPISRIWSVIVEGLRHLYHGTKLFVRNTRLAAQLTVHVRKGQPLTRRERLLLEQATIDLLRLVPFSFFVIVPGAELLLPVALRMFPDLVPSTFETQQQGRNKAFAKEVAKMQARRKLVEFATTEILRAEALQKEQNTHTAEILRHLTTEGRITLRDIQQLKVHFLTGSPLCLEQFPSPMLKAMARLCGVWRWYHRLSRSSAIRARIRDHSKRVQADDLALLDEGISMLTREELENANAQRGMRWVDDDAALVSQLQDWTALSTDPDVPMHLLFVIKPTVHTLSESLQRLPADSRERVLGVIRAELPAHVADHLSLFANRISHHRTKVLVDGGRSKLSADQLRERANEPIGKQVEGKETASTPRSSFPAEVRRSIRDYLRNVASDDSAPGVPATLDELFDELQTEAKGSLTLETLTAHLARKTYHSRHDVSTELDAFELDSQQPLKRKQFHSLISRLREGDEEDDISDDEADA